MKYISKIINQLEPEIFKTHPAVALYSTANVSGKDVAKEAKTKDELDAAQKEIALRVYTSDVTEATLKDGNIIFTSIDCYEVCTSIIRTLRQTADYSTIGYAVIFGSKFALSKSGIKALLEATPHCMIVVIDGESLKPSAESIEVYKAYVEQFNSERDALKEANKDSEGSIDLPKAKTKLAVPAYERYITWAYIMEVVDAVFVVTDSYTKLHGAKPLGALMRNVIATGKSCYIYKEGSDVVEPKEVMNFEKVPAEVETYEDSDVIDFESGELTAALLGTKYKSNPMKLKLITNIDPNILADLSAEADSVVVKAGTFGCDRKDIMTLVTSVLGDSVGELELENTEEQIKTMMELNLPKGKTFVLPLDKVFGTLALKCAYEVASKLPTAPGNFVILEGDAPEGDDAFYYVQKLVELGKAKHVKAKFLPRTFEIQIPEKDIKEDGKTTTSRKVTTSSIIPYILLAVGDKVITITNNGGSSNPAKRLAKFGDVCKSVSHYKYLKVTFGPNNIANEKEDVAAEWIKANVDIKNVLKSIYSVPSNKQVKGF